MESPFDVLAVDPDADDEAIERAYRERVKEAHPDQGGSVAEFQAVRRAYERIKAGYEEGGPTSSESATVENDGAAAGSERASAGEGRTTAGNARAGDWHRDTAAGRNRDQAGESAAPEQVTTEVTYLDYDVLADFGWDVDDPDLLGKAADADLDDADYGRFEVEPGESLLEAAEDHGYAWPFACRGGACANCAIKVLDGELSMPASHVLTDDLMEQGIRLSCNGMPITDELAVLYNVKHMPELDDLLLPPDPFENRYADD